jgi:intracellular septation protein
MSEQTKPNDHAGLRLALDYGPLVIFFGVYKYFAPETSDVVGTLSAIVRSTAAFMVAIIIAAIVAKLKLGRISPMMWLTTILVVGFGGLTIWFNDAKFIQIKPTIIYVILSGLLFGGLFLKKPLMKYVFEAGYDGLSERGWMMLSRNWAWFFGALAVINEIVRAQFTFDDWLSIKVWGVTIVSFLFAAANIPMLMREGLGREDEEVDASKAD